MLLIPSRLFRHKCRHHASFLQQNKQRWSTTSRHTPHAPLRILFCGADSFSIASLKALHEESKSPSSNILSIDVVTKKDKLSGRGLKRYRSPPIKATAQDLGLRLHQIDSFTQWSPPKYEAQECPNINLVIAVSFGLLIPPRIINNSHYGGLNVHPSMLPDLPGAAPVQWSIMFGRRYTGVSIQTLHPTKFDEGVVLSQTPSPGLVIPDPDSITAAELRDRLAPVGAEMLVQAIRDRLYVPPHKAVKRKEPSLPLGIFKAPRITTEMKAVDFQTMTRLVITRRNRAIPKLWAIGETREQTSPERRIIFEPEGLRTIRMSFEHNAMKLAVDQIPAGVPFTIVHKSESIRSKAPQPLLIKAANRDSTANDLRVVEVARITVAGSPPTAAAQAAAKAGMFKDPVEIEDMLLYRFHGPLRVPLHTLEAEPKDKLVT